MNILYSPFADDVLVALADPVVTIAIAAKIHFKSGITRVHTGLGEVVIEGETYLGVGQLGEIGGVSEEHSTSPSQISMTLSGLDSSLIAETLNERVIGQPVETFLVIFNPDQTVRAAVTLFEGDISNTALIAGGQNALNYSVSSVFERWQNGVSDRYTEESHTARHPGDHLFKFVGQTADRSIYWGSAKDAIPYVK